MFISPASDTGATAKLRESVASSQGFVMNLTNAWGWRPDVFDGFAALREQLTRSSSLSKREQALLVCASAAQLGDAYCSLAWGRKLAVEASPAVAAAVISGSHCDELSDSERALATWARKVVHDPNGTVASDVQALRDVGLSDRDIFEATVFIAFRQAFSTVNDALGVDADRELLALAPVEVTSAIKFGRLPQRGLVIAQPTSRAELDAVRQLMRSFIAWHRERHVQDLALIDAYFDTDAFEEELAGLPGHYIAPHGDLLLASLDGEPAGCVALRAIDDDFCEMKRMFVYPRFHGQGVGLALGRQIIESARALGYRGMRLDTSIRQAEATGLYQRLGFRLIEPYYELPQTLRDWLIFMELRL